jgi:DNA-directed RNA polymerase subunit F
LAYKPGLSRIRVAGACALAATSLVACGHSGEISRGVAVRVGKISISTSAVDRWMLAMAPEHVLPDPPRYSACIAHQEALDPLTVGAELKEECARQYQALRGRVLSFLISSAWLIEEAAGRGLLPSAREVHRRLGETDKESSPGTSSADREFAARAALAEAELRRIPADAGSGVTRADVTGFYRRNIQQFEKRERRYVTLVEQFPTEAAARRFLQEVTEGRRSLSSRTPYYESLVRPNIARVVPRKRAEIKAIFAAKPHVPLGPERLNGYSVFEVTRIIPRTVQSLSTVEVGIEKRLVEEARKRALARFVRAWRKKWRAKTDCHPSYVVQQCRQYRGARSPEGRLTFTS